MPEDVGSFLKGIAESDAAQFLKLTGTVGGAFAALTGFISLFGQSDTDRIVDAIGDLQAEMGRNFQQLGDLIKQQTQIVVDTVNRDTMALALSNSDAAYSNMQDFLANNNTPALQDAKTNSVEGVSFFTNLGLDAPDLPFFLPGLVKAGTIRILVIASEPDGLREPRDSIVQNVNSMVDYLAAMIDRVKGSVTWAHTVRMQSHSRRCPPFINIAPGEEGTLAREEGTLDELPDRIVWVVDGFSHEERGTRLDYFEVPLFGSPCDNPQGPEEIDEARSSADQARDRGVEAELAFLGIPGFEQILQSWRNLLS